jgi:SAM-dependent methyltransferase
VAPRTPRGGRPPSSEAPLDELAVPGLHRHLATTVVPAAAPQGRRAVDLGAGSGAFATRLLDAGFDVLACDADPEAFRARVPFRRVDLDDARFADALGLCTFDLVTAIEVIEHLEAPTTFLRNVARLLSGRGVAVVTTPNIESLAARLKFAATGRLRLFDAWGDPTHVSPIFYDLLVRHHLERAGLALESYTTFPPRGHVVGRPAYTRVLNVLGPVAARRQVLVGDSHVFVLRRREP